LSGGGHTRRDERPTTDAPAGAALGRLGILVAIVLTAAVGALALAAPATAASRLDATAIDAFLATQGSPLTGSGTTFVAEGTEHGVDPAFLVAVAGAESSFGLFLYSSDGDQATFNAFNWFYTSPWTDADFGSWDEAVGALAAGIAGDLYYGAGLYSVAQIGPRYCPDGTGNWLANVTLFMERLGGDPADTRWTVGPPLAAPALLAVDGHVELSAPPRIVGEAVEARFTIANVGSVAVEVADVRLAVRDADGEAHDLAAPGPFTLAPGEARAFEGAWTLWCLGEWDGWIELRYGDQRVLLGTAPAFAFSARLPRDPAQRRSVLAQIALSRPL
jgi:hypothetical protein